MSSVVERAIIMAAGEGKRMRPVTLSTPKPLIRVNGVRMIDTVIQGLQMNGITEIYIVVGYLKEQFACLETEYEGVRLIENPFYKECNNISSLYVAREYLSNSIILDGDQIVSSPGVLAKEFELSGYNCIWTDKPTKEWILTLDGEKVVHCSRDGGECGWQLFSVSRWNHEDGLRLKALLEYEFERKNTQIYWDDVALNLHLDQFDLGIIPMDQNAMVEIDTIEELQRMDSSYLNLGGM